MTADPRDSVSEISEIGDVALTDILLALMWSAITEATRVLRPPETASSVESIKPPANPFHDMLH